MTCLYMKRNAGLKLVNMPMFSKSIIKASEQF